MNVSEEAEFKKQGKTITTAVVDLTSRAAIEVAAKETLAKVGQVDMLVNNAGIVSGKPFMECTPEQIQSTTAPRTSGRAVPSSLV